MSLNLPEETRVQIAALLHDSICRAHEGDDFEDLDDNEHEECLVEDMSAVDDILELLDAAGVIYAPMTISKVNTLHGSQ